MVLHFCADGEGSFASLNLGCHEGPPFLHVNRVCLREPDMPVDPRPFIKPAVARRGIHAHQQNVLSARSGKVAHVKTERIVPTAVTSNVKAVEDHHCLPVRTVELDGDSLAGVRGRKLEDAAIPTHTRRRIGPSQRVESFTRKRRVVLERQLYSPIVGQIDRPPVAIVKRDIAGRQKVSSFLKRPASAQPEGKVLGRVVRIAGVEAPAKVEQQAFAARARCCRFGRSARRHRVRLLRSSFNCGSHRAHALGRHSGRSQQTGFQQITA